MKIDEDCMSCCLEKYRPLIREGFRMACINYNSQPVAICGQEYSKQEALRISNFWIDSVYSNLY